MKVQEESGDFIVFDQHDTDYKIMVPIVIQKKNKTMYMAWHGFLVTVGAPCTFIVRSMKPKWLKFSKAC